ncbi:hypothetical protein [Azohydromonas caseinilytica]|uniref:Thioredoxin family protein n=1 Tax=Azohydromonas caseinilytica TaxID=2728836 RepID=A0A848FCD2_9BURK|nr:hypothetical protein [Azohydromonas caseinilytica]NML16982.1 hypothetical protein [Azohydromonas caseinilytica]
MSGFDSSPNTFSFHSAFAGIPVVIEYEVEVNEDHRGRDVEIIPTVCVINDKGVDLCEDAGYFHPDQLKTWLVEAEADYKSLGADDSEPEDYTVPWAASAAEDCWIAQRDHAHYSRAGV